MFRKTKQVAKAGRARGLARVAVLAGVIIAGAGTGYLVSTALGATEATTYCSYLYQGLDPAQVNALVADGVNPKFAGVEGSYYICVKCGNSTSGCGDAPSLPTPLNPNNPPSSNIVAQSNTCGACQNPGTSS